MHYVNDASVVPAWTAITLLVIMLNYFVVQGMQMPQMPRTIVMLLSVASSFLFLTQNSPLDKFIFVALPVICVYIIASYYSKAMLRFGFLMIAVSNVVWVAARFLATYFVGHEISKVYRYDNDIYHLLLIVSTFIIYKAIAKGYWKLPS